MVVNDKMWIKKYEHDQGIALHDPHYVLPPFMPIKAALAQIDRELDGR